MVREWETRSVGDKEKSADEETNGSDALGSVSVSPCLPLSHSPTLPLPHSPSSLEADQVLFEDPHLLVVNKPAPLLTQAPEGIPNLEALAKAYIKAKYAKPGGVYLGVPHRLDRPVSGVVCFARNTKAAQRVHAQFEHHKVRKVYWAMVEGSITPDAGVWDNWLRKVPDEARVEPSKEGESGAKLAMLEYRVIQAFADRTLVELAPLTGRMHQLRVQCAWRGYPVLGDDTYGSTRAFGPVAELARDRVVALHARSLTITHPFTKQELTFIASLPAYWGTVETV